jgi:hypothetical protein
VSRAIVYRVIQRAERARLHRDRRLRIYRTGPEFRLAIVNQQLTSRATKSAPTPGV